VLARSAVVAEAVSTALLVLGRDAIDAVAHQMEVDVCWADRTGVYTTPWFPLKRFV
jgi:thiamine biosynthesis lipoprotein ApbE